MHCYVKNNLAYIPVPKCASTYYSNLLQANDWQECNTWELEPNTKLFTFILNPTTRFVKGLTEDLFEGNYPKEIEGLISNDITYRANILKTLKTSILEQQTIVPESITVTTHTIPYSVMLKDYKNITCIRLDCGSAKAIFLKLCKQHNITIQDYSVNAHISDTPKLEFYNALANVFTEDALRANRLYDLLYAEDYNIYNKS